MSDPRSGKGRSGGTRRLVGTGVELAAAVGGACLLGYWIDLKFESSPWGLLICALIGIVGGLYNLIRHVVHDVAGEGGRKTNHGKPQDDDRTDA